MIEGTVDYFLHELGPSLDDVTLDLTAAGTITTARAINSINAAQTKVLRRLIANGVRPATFARKYTLEDDSNDDDVSLLPYRTLVVLSIEDSSGNVYPPVYSRKRTTESGVIIERRAITTGGTFLPSVRWWGHTRPDTVYAWVVETPPKLSYGPGAAYAATTITLASAPTIGPTIENDDYYIGAEVAVVSGTYSGQVREISDYVASTRVATVATWTNTPSTNDNYSILTPLPRVTWDAVVAEATYAIAAGPDARWHDNAGVSLSHFRQNREDAFWEAHRALSKAVLGAAYGPREAVIWVC